MTSPTNISIIGIGKLGLCFSLTLERAGYNILGVDVSTEYITNLNSKNFLSSEPGVSEALQTSLKFKATTSLQEAFGFSNVLYILVATPSLEDGSYDHSQIEKVVSQLLKSEPPAEKKYLIIGCTTMPEYCDTLQERLKNHNYEVCYNPEFIAQGSILADQRRPAQVLIGASSPEAIDTIKAHYQRMTDNEPAFCIMSRTEAEICKLATNCFLTTKISYANMIGDLCIKANANPNVVLKSIGADHRISSRYLGHGFGYGGPCFPRDNRALAKYSHSKGVNPLLGEASDKINELHLEHQVEYYIQENPDKKVPVRFDYVTYKRESTLITESQQLKFAARLAEEGYIVTIEERPEVIREVGNIYGDLFTYENKKKMGDQL